MEQSDQREKFEYNLKIDRAFKNYKTLDGAITERSVIPEPFPSTQGTAERSATTEAKPNLMSHRALGDAKKPATS